MAAVSLKRHTARRLSDKEHQFFESYAQICGTNNPLKVHREGNHYRQNGIEYTDTPQSPQMFPTVIK